MESSWQIISPHTFGTWNVVEKRIENFVKSYIDFQPMDNGHGHGHGGTKWLSTLSNQNIIVVLQIPATKTINIALVPF